MKAIPKDKSMQYKKMAKNHNKKSKVKKSVDQLFFKKAHCLLRKLTLNG